MPWEKLRAKGEIPAPRKLYMGFELELEKKLNVPRKTDARAFVSQVQPKWVCGTDDSLYDGWEFRSQPFTWKYFQDDELCVDRVFTGLQQWMTTCNRYGDPTAGFHVHVSRSAFTDAHLARFVDFQFAHKDLCEAIAGRKNSVWANFNLNYVFERNEEHNFREKFRKTKQFGQHYDAVNCSNRNTIELRYFKSTTNPDRFRGYIEWVKALYDYTRNPRALLTEADMRNFVASKPEFSHAHAILSGKIQAD